MSIRKHLGDPRLIQFIKFAGVGVLNTILSLAVITLLMMFGVDYKLSNLIGYVVGVINSFFWSKFWVFRSKKSIAKEMFIFLLVFLVCYGANFLVLLVLVEKVQLSEYWAQPLAMIVYTGMNFLLNRMITFRT